MTEPRSLAAQLRELEASWSAVARSLLARRWGSPGLDITHPQYYALHHVSEQRSMSVAQLGAAMRMPEEAAARVVDRLARAGLVQRRLDPADRRTVMIEPTTHGRETLATVRRLRFDELKSMLQRLGDDEREELIRLFNKMAADDGEANE